jgi:hypothetical protein
MWLLQRQFVCMPALRHNTRLFKLVNTQLLVGPVTSTHPPHQRFHQAYIASEYGYTCRVYLQPACARLTVHDCPRY